MAKTITGDRHALMTGALLGLLLKSREDGLLNMRIQPVVDDDGDYTNMIELYSPEDDSLVFIITVDTAV